MRVAPHAGRSRHTPRLLTRASRAVLGEGPVWDERAQILYWVDIERGELHHCRADGSAESSWPIGQKIGCVALRADQPGFIAGLECSLAYLTLNPLTMTPVAQVPQSAHTRCNDGKCDAQGRFWVGTYDQSNSEATGWFYRFDARGLVSMLGPYVCTNGPAFAPDGRIMYCVDSYGKTVYRHDLTPAGDLSEGRSFRRFDQPGWGFPDGLTCDADGCVWIAHWGGSRVSRFDPAGELIEFIELPVAQPTSCTFGGADFKRLFVTSAASGIDPGANTGGLAGAVFAVDLDVGGLPAARFGG